ncbi:MAG: GAF domain-containing sensor histidine kinase [Spirulinaceae cyanobacterium]
MFVPASQEFVALCQAQIAILTKTLGAAWSAVYLTQGWLEESRKLIPVAVHPEVAVWQNKQTLALSPETWRQVDSSPKLLDGINKTETETDATNSQSRNGEILVEELLLGQHQIVLPLIHEEVVMGLLVTRREDRDWNDNELAQIENIARTLTIAYLLDKRQKWYKQKLNEQKNFALNQKDRLDDLLHQLRNPLTALRTFSKLLLKRLLPGDRNHKLAKSMIRESDRLQELLQQMDLYLEQMEVEEESLILEASSKASGNSTLSLLPGKLELSSFQVEEVLEPLLISAEAIAQERKLQLISEIAPDLPPVKANPLALREVLNNLIDNALKYTPPGGKIYLRSLERQTAQTIFQGIAIYDEGPGIPPQDQKHIFERHYRGVQSQGDIQGSGLGLAIAKELLEQMQGEIELISPVEGREDNLLAPGTTFIVWLPINEAMIINH